MTVEAPPPATVLKAFGLSDEVVRLSGGSRAVWKAGGTVLKRLHPTSLEHHASPEVYPWLAETLSGIAGDADGFRVARPLATRDGAWLAGDGWVASAWLPGEPAGRHDIGRCRAAVAAMHRALSEVTPPQLLVANESRFGRADRWAWSEPPWVHPDLERQVDRLLQLREPLHGLHDQLVHGDLNGGNMLVAPGCPVGFLDFAPFYRPPEFALAMMANWMGPRQGDTGPLHAFADVPQFEQLLVRAVLRMLFVVQEFEGVDHAEPELRAAEMVIDHLT